MIGRMRVGQRTTKPVAGGAHAAGQRDDPLSFCGYRLDGHSLGPLHGIGCREHSVTSESIGCLTCPPSQLGDIWSAIYPV